MVQMIFFFFSMHNFEREDGGTVRMYGVMNALAEEGHEVVFISNVRDKTNFHSNIKHFFIGREASISEKRIMQGLTALLPAYFVCLLFRPIFNKIKVAIHVAETESEIFFFEYLDNTIGYLLKKNRLVHKYINDVHGVVTLEFKYQWQNATTLKQRLLYWLKYKLAYLHDKKVFENADGVLYASFAMQSYFKNLYPNILGDRVFFLPNALSYKVSQNQVDFDLRQEIAKALGITDEDFVFLFAGSYKATAGVEDLICAFSELTKSYTNIKLLLIGEGPSRKTCEALVEISDVKDKITFVNRIPYTTLPTYQDLAKVIVCPDRDNDYSHLIIHLKYYDSLLSGKVVINGNFKSVLELNKEEELSLGFTPSDVESLKRTMAKSIDAYESLSGKYKNVKQYVVENLTYRNFIRDFHKRAANHIELS